MQIALTLFFAILSSSGGFILGSPLDSPPSITTTPIGLSSRVARGDSLAALPDVINTFPPLPTSLPYPYRVWGQSSPTSLTLVVWQMMLFPVSFQDILMNIINAQNAVFRGAVAHGFNSTIPQDGLEWAFGGCWLQLTNASPKRLTWAVAADVLFGVKGFMRRFGVWTISFDVQDDGQGVVGRGYYGP